jgi:hypothetical protein
MNVLQNKKSSFQNKRPMGLVPPTIHFEKAVFANGHLQYFSPRPLRAVQSAFRVAG